MSVMKSTITWSDDELFNWVLQQAGSKRQIPSFLRSILSMIMHGVLLLQTDNGVGIYKPRSDHHQTMEALAQKRAKKMKLSPEEEQKLEVYSNLSNVVEELKQRFQISDETKSLIEETKQFRDSTRHLFSTILSSDSAPPPPPSQKEMN